MEQFLQQLINGLVSGSSYALMALGLALIYGIMHVANFALGAIYMIGAFLSYYTVRALGGSYYLLSLPIGMIFTMGIGAMTEKFAFRKVQNAPHSTGFIVALGLYMILEGTSAILFHEEWREIVSPYNAINIVLGPVQMTMQRLLIFSVCVCLSILVYLLIMKTLTGKMIRATSQNLTSAHLVGIDVNKMNMLTFGIGSALAAAAGIMIAPTFMVAPHIGLGPVTKAFVVIILGGLGSIRGAVLGGFVLGLVETLGAAYISSMYKDAFAFGILVVVLIIKPTGLFRR
jgi:branched-chain amino acid transport system permease protein